MSMILPISAPSASKSPSFEESIPPRSPFCTMSKPDQTGQVLQSPQQEQDQAYTNNASTTTMRANNTTNAKHKPSRRAERRATHNAFERQRRETLNGRFLDLAALLPNLSQVRRPSKSSIVNSSITHIRASHRHRLLAARELRMLKLESDALRCEVNEWRNRAGISILEEPVRTEAFSMVISGELESITGAQSEEEDDDMAYGGFDGEDPVAPQASAISNTGLDDIAHSVLVQQPHYNFGYDSHFAHIMSRYNPHTRSRPENKDTHVALPSTKSPMSNVSSPSLSDLDSRLGVNDTMSPSKRRRISTGSASEPSSSPGSYGSFENFSNMTSMTSNSLRSFMDYPGSNHSSFNGGSPSPNAQYNASHNWSNSNGMAKVFEDWSKWHPPMATNQNRSRPGSAQSGSSGGRSDSP